MVSFRSDLAADESQGIRARKLISAFWLMIHGRMLGAVISVTLVAAAEPSSSSSPPSVVDQWLERAQEVKSWEAHFIQTRYLKALTQPQKTSGRIWFAAPDQFRWELGEPAQSLVLRDGPHLLLLAPRVHRAEEIFLTNHVSGPLQEALTLLDTGFPRDAAAFHYQYKLLSTQTNAVNDQPARFVFRMQPKASGARRLLPEITVEVTAADLQLTATELKFADGSRMRNDFTDTRINPVVDPERFRTNLDASWKITTPAVPK